MPVKEAALVSNTRTEFCAIMLGWKFCKSTWKLLGGKHCVFDEQLLWWIQKLWVQNKAEKKHSGSSYANAQTSIQMETPLGCKLYLYLLNSVLDGYISYSHIWYKKKNKIPKWTCNVRVRQECFEVSFMHQKRNRTRGKDRHEREEKKDNKHEVDSDRKRESEGRQSIRPREWKSKGVAIHRERWVGEERGERRGEEKTSRGSMRCGIKGSCRWISWVNECDVSSVLSVFPQLGQESH